MKIIENNVFLEDKGLKKGQDLKIIYKIIDCEEDSVKLIPDQLFRDSNAVVDPILNISILLLDVKPPISINTSILSF